MSFSYQIPLSLIYVSNCSQLLKVEKTTFQFEAVLSYFTKTTDLKSFALGRMMISFTKKKK